MKKPINFEISGFSFQQAATELEKQEHIRIRKIVLVEQFASTTNNPELFAAKMEADSYDQHSVFFNCYREGNVVATIRCVRDSPLGFPLEEEGETACDQFRELGKVIEAGRFAITRPFRLTPVVFYGLLECVRKFSLAENVRYIVQDMPERLLPLYLKMGFQVFGKPFDHHYAGQKFYPGYFNMAQYVWKFNQNDPQEADFQQFQIKKTWSERLYWFRYYILLIYTRIFQPRRRRHH
jgi:hypothetical protein